MDFGGHRLRSNTAQRLEKMDQERKKAAKTKHIKWEMNPVALTSNIFILVDNNMITLIGNEKFH